MPGIIGSSRTFGRGRTFIDEENKKEITNYKEWERAGYRDPLDTHTDSNVREGIRRKVEKITKYDNKKKFHVSAS